MLTFDYIEKGVHVTHIIEEYTDKEHTTETIRKAVNDEWFSLQCNEDVKDLRSILDVPGGMPIVRYPDKENKPMTYGIWAKFSETTKDGKEPKWYPFECDKPLKEHQKFIAMPNGIPTIAIVVRCAWTERSKVIKAANGHKLFKIQYVVNEV